MATSRFVRAALGAATLTVMAITLPVAPAAAQRSGGATWSSDFEERGSWRTTFKTGSYGNMANAGVVDNPAGGGKALRVDVQGSGNQRQRQGVGFNSSFDALGIGGRDEAWLSYDVYVPNGHDFVAGGKLPGLAGTSRGRSAWSIPTGGTYHEDGWSGRLHFLGDGTLSTGFYVKGMGGTSISSNRNSGNGRVYGIMRHFTANGRKVGLERGKWNRVELHYKLNTPGQRNGTFRGWVNGTQGVSLDAVEYRASGRGDLDINLLFFSYFYGGPKGPTSTQQLYFDNVRISASRG